MAEIFHRVYLRSSLFFLFTIVTGERRMKQITVCVYKLLIDLVMNTHLVAIVWVTGAIAYLMYLDYRYLT